MHKRSLWLLARNALEDWLWWIGTWRRARMAKWAIINFLSLSTPELHRLRHRCPRGCRVCPATSFKPSPRCSVVLSTAGQWLVESSTSWLSRHPHSQLSLLESKFEIPSGLSHFPAQIPGTPVRHSPVRSQPTHGFVLLCTFTCQQPPSFT
jgi:hypothetical protein